MAKSLPFDIIHKIIILAYNKQLWPIDFYNLCLVSQSFYNIAAPLLWSNPQLYSIYDFYKFLQGFYIIFSSSTEDQCIKQDILKIKKLDLSFLSSYNNEFQNQYNSFSSSFSNNYLKVNNPYTSNSNTNLIIIILQIIISIKEYPMHLNYLQNLEMKIILIIII